MSLRLTWHKIKRWLKFWQAGKKAMLVVFLLVIGAAIYAVIAMWPESEIERKAAGREQAKEIDSYERVVEVGSLGESIQFIKTFNDDPDDQLTVRIEKLQKKYDLAQRIIDLSTDETSENIGHMNCLEARFDLERLFNSNGLAKVKTTQQFKSQAQALAGNKDKKISRLAELALIYLSAFEISDEVPSDNAIRQLHDLVAKFGEKYSDDSFSVLQLVQYAAELQQASRLKGSYEFLAALSDAYADNENETIKNVIAKVERIKLRKKFSLVGADASGVEMMRQSVLDTNKKKAVKLIDVLTRNPVPRGEYLELLNCFLLITQAGYPEETRPLLEQSKSLFDHSQIPEQRKQRFKEVNQLIDRVGATIAIAEPVAAELRNQPTLLLLVPSSRLDRFPVQLKSIGDMTREMISRSNLDVIAVLLEEEQEEESWAKFNEWISAFPGIKTFRLPQKDTETFLADYPMNWYPTWLLLDSQKRLSQISPPYPILEEMLLDVIEASSP